MKEFTDLELVENYAYEVSPEIAEELGAFVEDAISEDDFIDNYES